ncbi:hypothetical protein B9Z19DRAFT_1120167 [Tuber borchii]|uniref:Uncharacterized protein n=1 Tax=Tuber borchii TaxID=42251 RepID=A0A2T7A4W5_TUBBO|nr:hypothetical protein B9Z19DRAFT_1120167 [Tuber borchii]
MPITTPEHTKEPPRSNHRNSEFPYANDAWSDTAILWTVDKILSYTPHYYWVGVKSPIWGLKITPRLSPTTHHCKMSSDQYDLARANHEIEVLNDRILELENLIIFLRIQPMESNLYNEQPPFKEVADRLEATKEGLIGEREELMGLIERLKESLRGRRGGEASSD